MPEHGPLGHLVQQLIAYRGWSSPEALDYSYRPERAPVGGATIRRIIDGSWQRDDELTLLRLAGMLKLPPLTLVLIAAGDIEGLRHLDFSPDDAGVRGHILDAMEDEASPKSKTRSRRTGT